MTSERFSYIVEDYFYKSDTYPATLMFKNTQVTDQFLIRLDNRIHDDFGDANKSSQNELGVVKTKIVEGDYWSGVLVEFNQREFSDIDSDKWNAHRNGKTLYSKLQYIYDEFKDSDTRIIGLSVGDSVYAVASLESLGRHYFETP